MHNLNPECFWQGVVLINYFQMFIYPKQIEGHGHASFVQIEATLGSEAGAGE